VASLHGPPNPNPPTQLLPAAPPDLLILIPRPALGDCQRAPPAAWRKAGRKPPEGLSIDAGEDVAKLKHGSTSAVSGRMQQVPRLLNIGMHLSDQCLFPRILHLAAEPGVEIDCDLNVVKFEIIMIQHVRLDSPF
jgi:hypothetical protein